MRAIEALHEQLKFRLGFLHAKRFGALWCAVQALITGQQLWLTALGRAWPTKAKRKHSIKAMDRLLGNKAIHRDRFLIAAEVARLLIGKHRSPIVAVDTMEIRHKVVAFTASVTCSGRALPLWSTTIRALRADATQCRRFLKELTRIIPKGCVPIIITDGGFEGTWFDAVEALGWHYVGRVRGQTKFFFKGRLVTKQELHAMASKKKAKNLGEAAFPAKRPDPRRLVLSRLPINRHRNVQTRNGPSRDGNYRHYRKNAHEPLLLATSLSANPEAIVAIYEKRMQIEQSFRDMKCHRWGWSLRHCLTGSRQRLEILLLIAAIAMIVQHLAGLVAERAHLQRDYQANTIRTRRVLSVFLLGAFVLRDELRFPRSAFRAANLRLSERIQTGATEHI